MTTRRFIVGIFRFLLALALTGGLCYAAFFAFIMVVCTGGGALVIVIPVAIVVLPIYYGFLRYCVTGSFRGHKKNNPSKKTGDNDTRKDSRVRYIIDMRRLGIGDEEIVRSLLNAGWQRQEIEDAMKHVTTSPHDAT